MSNPHTSRAMRQFLKIFSQVSPIGLCAMVFTELYQLCFCFLLCNACLVSMCVQCVEANWIARVQWTSCLMLAVRGPGITPGCCGGCQSGLMISSWGFLAWRWTTSAVCEKGAWNWWMQKWDWGTTPHFFSKYGSQREQSVRIKSRRFHCLV